MIELNFPNAVREEKDYFGRKEDLDRIVHILTSRRPSPLLLLGERRVGKTSTLNIVLSRIEKIKDPQFVTLMIEPRGIRTLDVFARNILQRLCTVLGQSISKTDLLDKSGNFRLEVVDQFENAFYRIIEGISDKVFILCVDEFDEIIRSAEGDELPKIMGLLSFLTERSKLPLSILFTMTGLPEILQRSFPTPFTNVAEIVELSLLSDFESREMVINLLKDVLLLSDKDLSWFFQVCGGHPYFTKLLIANLIKNHASEKKIGKLSKSMIEQVLLDSEKDPRAKVAIENLYRMHFNDPEKDLMIKFAEKDAPLKLEELRRAGSKWVTAARQLANRQYLHEIKGEFYLHIGLLANWLRRWNEFEEEKERRSALRSRLSAPPPIIEIDEILGQVRVAGHTMSTSRQEYQIFHRLAEEAGMLVPRETLVDSVWGTTKGVTDQAVDNAFLRLRNKLGEYSDCLQTIPGRGFILNRAILISK